MSVVNENLNADDCLIQRRFQFPGAPRSSLVTKLEFLTPSSLKTIPSYHVMSTEGTLQDPTRPEPDVTDEQVLTWYKNMLTGGSKISFGLKEMLSDHTNKQLISWTRLCSRHNVTAD